MADQQLNLTVKVNTETGALEVLGSKLKDIGEKGKETGTSFGNLTGAGMQLASALGVVATGAGIIEFFKKAVTEANADAEALRRLQFTLEANGVSWATNKDKIMLWSEGLQETTRFSNTQALEALGKLSKSTKDVGQAQEGVKVAMGLSVGTGMDLNNALDLMQNLMAGNERAVTQARRELGAFVGTASNAQEVMDRLSAKFGDAALKEESFTKSSSQMTNAWDDFSKQVGNAFIPALSSILDILTWLIARFQDLGAVIAGFTLGAVEAFSGMSQAIGALMTGHFKEVEGIIRETTGSLTAIAEGTVDSIKLVEDKKTEAVKAATGKRSQIVVGTSLQDQKQKQNEAVKFLEIETELQKKLDSLGQQTFKKKLDILNAETELKRAQINKEIEDQARKAQLLVDLERYKSAAVVQLNKEEADHKIEASFKVANIAVQALQTINSMSEQDSAAEKARAIALLALQQAIAIGWAWVHAVRIGGPFAPAIAAAETALLVAQFASQVQAVNSSHAASQTQIGRISQSTFESPGLSITTGTGPITGANGERSTLPGSFDSGSSLFSGFNDGSGGVSFAPSSGGGGGSGGGVSVNIPQITINVAVETLEVADRRRILQALADELRSGTVDAIRFAVTSANLSQSNGTVAV